MRFDPDEMRLKLAQDLREVAQLYVDLWAEVTFHADDKEMPGGDAMNLLGPAANLEAWQHRYDAAERRAEDAGEKLPEYVEDQLDTEGHPLLVLATWEDAIREERDQVTTLRATVPSAVRYLRSCIDWALRTDTYGDMEWLAVDALARDLHKVRTTLEGVLRNGIRTDKGADCFRCNVALVHIWKGDHRDPKTIEDDEWRCPKCGETSKYKLYLKILEADYMARATWLQANHMELHYGISVGTLQGWASKEHVRKRRNVNTGRMVYHVKDALERRDKAAEERVA